MGLGPARPLPHRRGARGRLSRRGSRWASRDAPTRSRRLDRDHAVVWPIPHCASSE